MANESKTKTETKFHIDIEGTIHDWDAETITVAQIRELGGIPAGTPVVEVDLKENTERTLGEDEVVELRPGMGFSKKIAFKRG